MLHPCHLWKKIKTLTLNCCKTWWRLILILWILIWKKIPLQPKFSRYDAPEIPCPSQCWLKLWASFELLTLTCFSPDYLSRWHFFFFRSPSTKIFRLLLNFFVSLLHLFIIECDIILQSASSTDIFLILLPNRMLSEKT